jgi:hypothetical protein
MLFLHLLFQFYLYLYLNFCSLFHSSLKSSHSLVIKFIYKMVFSLKNQEKCVRNNNTSFVSPKIIFFVVIPINALKFLIIFHASDPKITF